MGSRMLTILAALALILGGVPGLSMAEGARWEAPVASPSALLAATAPAAAQAKAIIAAGVAEATSAAAGSDHSCAVTAGGGVKCWGWNGYGQLGDGTTLSRSTAVDVEGLTSGVVQVAAGLYHSCVVTVGGGVKCWGLNGHGQLGDGTTTTRSSPVDVVGLTSGVIAVATGQYHSCAAIAGGGVQCWGWNGYGQLGDGTGTDHSTPVDVVELTSGVIAVAAGQYHSCAVTAGGGAKCWGWNGHGQLGDGTTADSSTPVDVVGLLSGVAELTAGQEHSCAVTAGGGLKCWGWNQYGQLGDGTTTDRSTPVDVEGLTSGVAAAAAGYGHSCALTAGGGVKCWGWNEDGQLGDRSTTDRNTPVAVVGLASGVAAAAAGLHHSCAVTTAGGVRCWGDNSHDQLGDGTTTDRSWPADVVGLASGVIAVAAGQYHSCAVTAGGGVKCWGWNGYGQLGNGTTTDHSMPVDVVGLTSGVVALTAGMYHTCAVIAGGGLRCWVWNGYGQLGDGTTTDRSTPVDVMGLTSGVAAAAAGGYHTCVVTGGGGAKCWGWNGYGELGDGTTTNHSTPADVVGLTSGVKSVTAGRVHNCALTTAGGVKCWGWNGAGQLGDGTTTDSSTAVDVEGLTSDVLTVAAGGYHSCAVTAGGGVKCWGWNEHGQLGDETTIARSMPVDVRGLAGGVASVAGGSAHSCGTLTGGGVMCWGYNESGQLGDETRLDSGTAVDVVGLAGGVIAMAAGGYHTCAVTAGGTAKCWGSDDDGQLGLGTSVFRVTPVDVVGFVESSLKLLVVPLRWEGTQAAFIEEAQTQIDLFLGEVPLGGCQAQASVEMLDVVSQNYATFACSATDCGVSSVRSFVREQLGMNPARYDVIIGLAETSPCAPIAGCSNGTHTVWVTAQQASVTAHELGHIYGLEDEYCSTQAGSADGRCNDGDSQGDGAASGDLNWLDASLPCDCPADGSVDSGNAPCCNFGGRSCGTVDYGICCLGNRNAAGGRSTMSYADAPEPRGFDAHDLAHLSTLPELSCSLPTGAGALLTDRSSVRLVDVALLIHPDDSVTEQSVAIGYGRPTSSSVRGNLEGSYALQVKNVGGDVVWSQDFAIVFDYEGPMLLDVDTSAVGFGSVDVSFRIPASCGMSAIELYHGEELVFSRALVYVCMYLPLTTRSR